MTKLRVARRFSLGYGKLELLDQFPLPFFVFCFRIGLIKVPAALVPPYRWHRVVLDADVGNAVCGRDPLEDQTIEFSGFHRAAKLQTEFLEQVEVPLLTVQ